ncbi:GNAT family N-acetyltransferase [Aliiroseovarius sp. PrR006]|uniref:GNAT family N-acetyltransferase n=1 Tax=Aliiroseovarius sp. PrR006 TaxID=2706883 RepID=UPI0013D5D05E|nr:GNAT family N-acetyltransferase [Aliiroseovarius sp. PrR006]NDW54238.1 GNAT family N-acetyltransferase [Aliiroseovarius sp. PrR006]
MPRYRFTTQRLSVFSWHDVLADPAMRASLEAELSGLLTPKVLEHLPPPLQLEGGKASISDWIDARSAESEVHLVEDLRTSDLLGLLILAEGASDPDQTVLHIGYLFAQHAWGQGYASEMLVGLCSVVEQDRPARLAGGVDRQNQASARVLQKAGFELNPELSSSDTDMYVREFP